MAKTSEGKLGLAVMQVLAECPNNEATVRTLIKNVPNHMKLTADDQLQSATRPNEEMWEQRVRNLRSHSGRSGNVIAEGFVLSIGRGRYRLTPAGLSRLRKSI
jgi:Mrr N-terminal domain